MWAWRLWWLSSVATVRSGGHAPQSRKTIRMVGNGGPITGCLIHRVTTYSGFHFFLLNCQLHWSVNLVVMSIFILSKLVLNYTHTHARTHARTHACIYTHNFYIRIYYIQSLLGCRVAPSNSKSWLRHCGFLAMDMVGCVFCRAIVFIICLN